MHSVTLPVWNGPFAYGRAVVANSVRGAAGIEDLAAVREKARILAGCGFHLLRVKGTTHPIGLIRPQCWGWRLVLKLTKNMSMVIIVVNYRSGEFS